jgi:SNF2 family DNA or RNA helicase
MQYNPFPYQEHTAQHIVDNPNCGLFLEMGLGKTVSTLTAIDELMNDKLEISKVLVIAPKRVAIGVWPCEVEKWDHLKHLRISTVVGTKKQRKEALKVKADVYVINRENVAWLVAHLGGSFPFDMLVIDELTSFKSSKSVRFKALRMVRPKAKRVVGLTGTPAPNGLMDLWAQLYLLDQGERLGKSITGYRDKYFTPGKRNGHIIYEYKLKKEDPTRGVGDYEKEIFDKISDICISMKAKDYLDLPGMIDRTIEINLPADIRRKYDEFERDQVLALKDQEITAVNRAGLRNKLLQFSNGAVYDDKRIYHEIHNEKIAALEEILEALDGQPLLLWYSYQHDLHRIQRHLKRFNPYLLKTKADEDLWNAGKISFGCTHPASMGHGSNLQYGGHNSLWMGPIDNLEMYLQGVKRLDRMGQLCPVINRRMVCKSTIDEIVIQAQNTKGDVQEALMHATNAIIAKHLK